MSNHRPLTLRCTTAFTLLAVITTVWMGVPAVMEAQDAPAPYTTNGFFEPVLSPCDINGKGHVAGVGLGQKHILYLWLAHADYGLPAGLHSYRIPSEVDGFNLSGFSHQFIDRVDFAEDGSVFLYRSNPILLNAGASNYRERNMFTPRFGQVDALTARDRWPGLRFKGGTFHLVKDHEEGGRTNGYNMASDGTVYAIPLGDPEGNNYLLDFALEESGSRISYELPVTYQEPNGPRWTEDKDGNIELNGNESYSRWVNKIYVTSGNRQGQRLAGLTRTFSGRQEPDAILEYQVGIWSGNGFDPLPVSPHRIRYLDHHSPSPGVEVESEGPILAHDINDKNQIVMTGDDPSTVYYYLPSGDYGVGGGLHKFTPTDRILRGIQDIRNQVLKISEDGKIYRVGAPGALQFFDIEKQEIQSFGRAISPDQGASIFRVQAINDQGTLVAFGSHPDTGQATVVLSRASRLTAQLEFIDRSPTEPVPLGETVRLGLTISASSALQETLTEAAFEEEAGLILPEEFELVTAPEDLTIGSLNPGESWHGEWEVKAIRPGRFTFRNHPVQAQDGEGNAVSSSPAELSGSISPLEVETKVTPSRLHIDYTPFSKVGQRCQDYETERNGGEAPDLSNCVELTLKVTNQSDQLVDRINVPGALDIRSLISAIEGLEEPLAPVRFYPPNGPPIDLTDPGDATDIVDLSLEPGESATFAWIVEAVDIDPDPEVDDSAELSFDALVLGSLGGGLQGEPVQQQSPEVEFEVVDNLRVVVPPEGGVRAYAVLPANLGSVDRVLAYVDLNEDDEPSPGESLAAEDVRLGRDTLGNRAVYFTPPPYQSHWPMLVYGEEKRVALWAGDADGEGDHLETDLIYTLDVPEGLRSVSKGLRTAFDEVFASSAEATELKADGSQAGARAEVILKQLLARSTNPLLPGGLGERSTVTQALEAMPWQLADYFNLNKGGMPLEALALPITFGQAYDVKPRDLPHTVLLTLATGTLCVVDDGVDTNGLASSPPGGGTLWLPSEVSPGTKVSVGAEEAHGWQFEWSADQTNGIIVENVLSQSRTEWLPDWLFTPDWVIGDWMQHVARKISTPSLQVGDEGHVDLRHQWLSHVYIQPHVEPNFGRVGHGGDRHGATDGWALSAQYRIPLDGQAEEGNEARRALVARQTYTLTNVYTDFEPAHCAQATGLYPQVSMTVSTPKGGAAPGVLKSTCRIEAIPQEVPGEANRYATGLFGDKDYPKYWASSSAPGANVVCGPVPIWWNMFDRSNTVPQVETEMIFDSDRDNQFYDYVSPDNVHIHHVRDWAPVHLAVPNKYTEAPGSFNGTIHFHWRWGKAYGEQFGDGDSLLPEDHVLLMGLANKDFPEDFQDFTTHISPSTNIKEQEKVLLVRSEQYAAAAGRQYPTFTTGFTNALGPHRGCLGVVFGMDFLGGYAALWPGFAFSAEGLAIRASETAALELLIRRREYLERQPFDPDILINTAWILESLAHSKLQFYSSLQSCLADAPEHGEGDHHHAEELHALPQESDDEDGHPRVDVIRFTFDEANAQTPLDMHHAIFAGTEDPDGYMVGPSLFPNSLGLWLYQRSETPTNGLTITFEKPLRHVLDLALGLRSSRSSGVVRVSRYAQQNLLGSTDVELAIEGGASHTLINIDSEEPFDRLTFTAVDSNDLLAVGAMVLSPLPVEQGDFNLDGKVDESDGRLFGTAYAGSGRSVPFWSRRGDQDGDGDIDLQDYAPLAHLFPCLLGVESLPELSQEPAMVGEGKAFEAMARPLGSAGEVSYAWTASLGTFDNPTSATPFWTAPRSIDAERVEATIVLTIRAEGCEPREITIIQPITRVVSAPEASFNAWAGSHGLTGDDALPFADPDADQQANVWEYVLGSSPKDGASVASLPQPLIDSSGLTTLSLPSAALTDETIGVTIHWSTDLLTWSEVNSNALEASDNLTMVRMLSLGKQLYFRLEVELAP